ncbi:MAG: helix-turn-helix domain-containing protein [Chloroflexota bacterium]|nr:MAG: transcriptional regulator [Chloroflexota bacterium]
MTHKIDYTVSSGNVFADLGVANPDEADTKADLAFQINSLIELRGLTQTEAAKVLGISQPKVSALMCGKLTGFSIERLLHFLVDLDNDVQIVVTSKATDSDRGHIRVLAQ